jgi:hypothetical protein|tara:strand:- start:190 stop:486 length:297 start_codon:yes stop_codon:yes gene_type:complete
MKLKERPYLGEDNTYEKQRRCRMADAIHDYLSDDTVDARRCYEEMLAEIDEIIDHHKTALGRAGKLKELMLGNRDIDFFDDKELATKWQYDKILLTEE